MSLFYIRKPDGSVENLSPMGAHTLLNSHNLVFSRQHFDALKQSIIAVSPGDKLPDHPVEFKLGEVDEMWQNLKRIQWDNKHSHHPITVYPAISTFENFFQLMIVMLRLRVEYDVECKDGLPELQVILNEAACRKINHWANILQPTGSNHMVHPAHLVAFALLMFRQHINER